MVCRGPTLHSLAPPPYDSAASGGMTQKGQTWREDPLDGHGRACGHPFSLSNLSEENSLKPQRVGEKCEAGAGPGRVRCRSTSERSLSPLGTDSFIWTQVPLSSPAWPISEHLSGFS